MNCSCSDKTNDSDNAKHLKAKVAEMAAKNPSNYTGAMAAELGVSEMDVVKCLPDEMVKEISKEKFDQIIEEVSTWGTLLVIAQNESTILEVKAPFPKGTYGHGYYNLKSNDSPVGGHIRASDLSAIFLVSKLFMGVETHSVQFFNTNGNSMFKLYLGRDENKRIIPEQMEKFSSLRNKV